MYKKLSNAYFLAHLIEYCYMISMHLQFKIRKWDEMFADNCISLWKLKGTQVIRLTWFGLVQYIQAFAHT